MTAHFISLIFFPFNQSLMHVYIIYHCDCAPFSQMLGIGYWEHYVPHCLTVERICTINKMDLALAPASYCPQWMGCHLA